MYSWVIVLSYRVEVYSHFKLIVRVTVTPTTVLTHGIVFITRLLENLGFVWFYWISIGTLRLNMLSNTADLSWPTMNAVLSANLNYSRVHGVHYYTHTGPNNGRVNIWNHGSNTIAIHIEAFYEWLYILVSRDLH